MIHYQHTSTETFDQNGQCRLTNNTCVKFEIRNWWFVILMTERRGHMSWHYGDVVMGAKKSETKYDSFILENSFKMWSTQWQPFCFGFIAFRIKLNDVHINCIIAVYFGDSFLFDKMQARLATFMKPLVQTDRGITLITICCTRSSNTAVTIWPN